jgi:hypothetical protein
MTQPLTLSGCGLSRHQSNAVHPGRSDTPAARTATAGVLPDGTPVIIRGGSDGTMRVSRTADGTPIGEPLAGHGTGLGAVAAGRRRTAPLSSTFPPHST